MNAQKNVIVIAVLSAAVGILATLLVSKHGNLVSPTAYGQVSEGVTSGYVVGILGQTINDRTPLFLVDTKAQTLLVYEYTPSRGTVYLRVARSFSADRELQDTGFFRGNVYEGPSVGDVQNLLRRSGK